ncbi:MipA/OmpV family protein [Burkholderia sp. BCC0097]|uniref:MipA/OmpV family protein n=1 Tax=Burkholderia sp. BCC0097 TaxID=2676289 RepID=UPI00158B0CD5|nr:MipA/OmpV family protein [Burkholderia sp. BCC0097]
MKTAFRRERPLWLIAASFALSSVSAWADEGMSPPDPDNTGLTILNNATNVTHWGLGAGVGIEPSAYRGDGTRVLPFPLVYFDNKWVQAIGTTVDLKIGNWSGVNVALRGQFSLFDGYSGSDAPILNGMEKRKGALWYGPALSWSTSFGTFSGSFLLGGNKGERAKIGFEKAFALGAFSITPHVGAEWLSNKYVDYYYGVRPSEARAWRAAYSAGSAVNMSAGTRVDYRLTKQQTMFVDVGVSRLGDGITDSPLVGRRFIPEARIGYMYRFK